MKLTRAQIGPFRSINTEQDVTVNEKVTVLVGMNEAGKTVFLKALERSADALGDEFFDVVEDYPRKDLTTYLKRHKDNPDDVTVLTYALDADEVEDLNSVVGCNCTMPFEFSVTHKYDRTMAVGLAVSEKAELKKLADTTGLSSDAKAAVRKAKNIRSIPEQLQGVTLTEPDQQFLKRLQARVGETNNWDSVLSYEAWLWLKPRIPKFLYFGEYELLPSKINLADLQSRVGKPGLKAEDQAVLALLRMADIGVQEFSSPSGYEPLKAKIEAVSINLTDQIMEFWKQNEDLEVEVDIKADPQDVPPFNNGPNLYLRIKNKRHRGVSTPFRQRSRGFIWFFSFLVWFDRVQHQLESEAKQEKKEHPSNLVVLLDEPGLNLHALAQRDFLRYIDELAGKHQVIYTTHSPFMVHMDRMADIRMVEDREKVGTVITSNLSGSDPRTIFPLQAALGWSIAQSLFISARNLLVEGPADLAVLTAISAELEAQGRECLRDDITIVPTGGLDKLATFIALLGGNDLEFVVFHDYNGAPDQRLRDLEHQRLLRPKSVLTAGEFRDVASLGTAAKPSDLEDMLPIDLYLDCFNKAFAKELGEKTVAEKDLPTSDRIISRLEDWLKKAGIQLKKDGTYNHYRPMAELARTPPKKLDPDTLKRFEALFKAVNARVSIS